MHHHGYTWLGDKKTFDKESIRRPPPVNPPTGGSDQDVQNRYREAVAVFPASEVPPLQTAHWLMKPPALVRGTWDEPKDAGTWLEHRLTEQAPRFASPDEADTARLTALAMAATEHLAWGGDVSLGHYLKGALFHSIALVTCTPNHTAPTLPCPTR